MSPGRASSLRSLRYKSRTYSVFRRQFPVMRLPLLTFAVSAAWLLPSVTADMRESLDLQREMFEDFQQRHQVFAPPIQDDFPDAGTVKRQDGSVISFANPASQEFFVDGTKIPDVPFDAGPSWAGLLPISGNANETRKLFFWFWPTTNASNKNDLTFWTNGGPGCSSLEGFLQENGPISWSWGQAQPTPNPWSWTNLSNVLWVEQPVGTGFSQGTPDISNDDELAAEVFGFLQQFLEVFSELKGSNFFVTGESYAGFYVPYIANYIYENPGLDLALKGIWIADPSLSYGVVQEEIPALRFAQANANVFPFNASFRATLQNISDTCGYTDYLDNFVTYPPKGQLPFPAGVINGTFGSVSASCRIHSPIERAVTVLNPAFDVYRVTETWPVPWSVLGFPRSTQEFIYFNRTDVQDAIHAPHITWDDCTNGNVYINPTTGRPGNDLSVPSTLSVLPNVIEKSERTVIVHGLADFILVAEGTRIAIQNMTWGGLQGFQTPIEPETFSVKNMGVYGNMHQERNLTYVEFFYSGHMTPQFVPWAAFQTIAYLLGKADSPSL
ncbi:alpha/beta-hydrolase [Auriscalpium vulgare]|uniref:Alpha/beta-hydrolase n=1 Tax=Auriscalpium vulgare TaxID=40419 RepID=A0ACB8SAT9_9AGAM|nr:alpha/beta-hydrolase [Auriscalpium vulgare]